MKPSQFLKRLSDKVIFVPVIEMYRYVVLVSSSTINNDNNIEKYLSVHMDLYTDISTSVFHLQCKETQIHSYERP